VVLTSPSLGYQRLTGSLKLFEGLGIRFSDRFADDSEQMGTAIKGSSEVSVKRGSRFEKCPTDFSGFRDIDPLERLVPDVEKMPHQSENFLAGQQVRNRSFHQSPVEKADSGR
jgi:hypothetical protein